METLITFLTELQSRDIAYRLDSVRDAVMVEVYIPGERWEVEFFADGHREVEVFGSVNGVLSDPEASAALERLIQEHDRAEAEEGR